MFFNDDETKLYTFEWHKNSETVLAHREIVRELNPRLFALVKVIRAEMFGNPSDELIQVTAPLDVKVFKYLVSVTR